jgi:hypothetical protein
MNQQKEEDFLDETNVTEDDDNLFDDINTFDDFDVGTQAPMNRYSDLLKELTNFDPIIQRRIRNWLGLEWDEKVKDYRQMKTAIINERGARWAIGCLETYQSKPNIITNLAREEYINIRIEIIELCWLVFPTKFDEFQIIDPADQWRLSNELQHSAFLVLAGAGDGKYTKFLGESHSVHENINMQPGREHNVRDKSGFFDGLKNKLLGRG